MTNETGGIDRRQLNVAILSAALSGLVPSAAATRSGRPLFDFAVAGGFFHGLEGVAGAFRQGERLTLRRDPDNAHDPFAVAVDRGGLMLGYMPREASEVVVRLLKAGCRLTVEVVGSLDPRPDQSDIADLVFTSFTRGDPRLRLTEGV